MRANQFIKELAYPGNIGMMELIKFQQVATPEEKVRMKFLLSTDKKAAWQLLQKVTDVQLHEETLNEIDMSPSSLSKMAANTGAIAGMEFEMIVPSPEDGDSEDNEFDFDADDRASSFYGIGDFFSDGDYNSNSDVERLMDKVNEDYYEWAGEIRSQLWQDEFDGFFRDEMADEFDFDEARSTAAEELDKDSDDDEVIQRVRELFDEFVEEQWEEEGDLYSSAYNKWVEDQELPDETEYFESEGLRLMSDIYNKYSEYITWPYLRETGGGPSLNGIGEEFSEMIGKPVNVSSNYHGAERKPGEYSLEPDSSIVTEDNETGIEFITPPIPVDELLSDLQKTIQWAKSKGAYTNRSTGLHMNISIPGKNMNYLDFTKLALLLGDKYVLESFGRQANHYTTSAVDKIKLKVEDNPEIITRMMYEMRKGMNNIASRTIADTDGFGKYTSINPKGGYVEFRSPGGDWLNEDIGRLTNTLLRFIVALDAALDPEKYRKEYLKKLYQILQPKSNEDPIAYFAQYSAGLLPKGSLKNFIRGRQTQRQYQKDVAANKPTGKMWWKVKFQDRYSVELVASNKEEAFDKAFSEYGLPIEAGRALVSQGKLTAEPIRPYEQAQEKTYGVMPEFRPEQEIIVRAVSQHDAYRAAQEMRPDIFGNLSMRDVNTRLV